MDKEKLPTCPVCGGTDTEEQGMSENSYGELVTVHLCTSCDIEFETKR